MATVARLCRSPAVAISQTLKNVKSIASNYPSPLGEILLLASSRGLRGLWFHGQKYFPELDPEWLWDDAPLLSTRRALDAYFAGETGVVLPTLDLRGTVFQQKVWTALLAIPAGETRTYLEIAQDIAAPSAVRAVGAAVGRNPVSILIPCHRVIGSSGTLTGYAGGLDRKSWMLSHESNRAAVAIKKS